MRSPKPWALLFVLAGSLAVASTVQEPAAATARLGPPTSQLFCDGPSGDLAACPCNNPGSDVSGCATPIPAMKGGGTTSGISLVAVSQSVTPLNRATMVAVGFPAGSTPGAVILRGNALEPSPVVFGDGLRCVAANSALVRLGASVALGGQSTHAFGHGTTAGTGTFFYQLWFRSTPASYCDPQAAFSLSNGATLTW